MQKIPANAVHILENRIPEDFVDDGCTNSPDSLFGKFDFRWACRIHDWRYCGRVHPAEEMTYSFKVRADRELRSNIRKSLPLRYRWVRYLYFYFVWKYGGIGCWNSCDSGAGERCRHNQRIKTR